MAARKVLLKMNHIEAVYKFVNDVDSSAALTVTLNTDLLRADETLNGQPVKVAIGAIEAAIADLKEVTIVRNALTITTLFENTNALTMAYGADHDQETSNITVNFTGKGTIYMRLLKLSGFAPTFKPEQNGGY